MGTPSGGTRWGGTPGGGAPDDRAGPRIETKRFGPDEWQSEGPWRTVSWELAIPEQGGFVRARGTNSSQAEPLADVRGEDPWQDLWFYSNPIFIQTGSADHAH